MPTDKVPNPDDYYLMSDQELEELRSAYNSCKRGGKIMFRFQGQDILVSYAKYLIEYTENRKASNAKKD